MLTAASKNSKEEISKGSFFSAVYIGIFADI